MKNDRRGKAGGGWRKKKASRTFLLVCWSAATHIPDSRFCARKKLFPGRNWICFFFVRTVRDIFTLHYLTRILSATRIFFIYNSLHKYWITPRRSLRRHVFFCLQVTFALANIHLYKKKIPLCLSVEAYTCLYIVMLRNSWTFVWCVILERP